MRWLLPLWLVGCGFGGPSVSRHGGCRSRTDGIVFISWTIGGAAPTAAACSGIDHLSVEIGNAECGATIAPVPCALDRWRYDNMPEGLNQIVVTAYDSAGDLVRSGTVSVELTTTVPSSPTKLDLQ